MTQIETGTLVEWSSQGIPSIVGHFTGYVNGKARLNVDGEKIDVTPYELRVVKFCPTCDEPITNLVAYLQKRQHFCSKTCFQAAKRADQEQFVFDAIVEYKRSNDGNSPDIPWVANRSGVCEMTVRKAIRRMVGQGRLIAIGKTKNRSYIIPGAKWVYEPEATTE